MVDQTLPPDKNASPSFHVEADQAALAQDVVASGRSMRLLRTGAKRLAVLMLGFAGLTLIVVLAGALFPTALYAFATPSFLVRSSSAFTSKDNTSVVVTFGGGGWYHAFYFGVGAAIAEASIDRSDATVRFGGVSAGSLVAATLAFELDLRQTFETALECYPVAARNPLKMVKITADSIKATADAVSDEVLQRVSDQRRLVVGISLRSSLSRLSARSVTEFRDRDYACQVLSASCSVPLLSGLRGQKIDGERYWDGGMTQGWDRLPMFDDVSEERDHIIRVVLQHSVNFSQVKEGWITPGMDLPLRWAFLPHSVDALRLLWRLGYLRTLQYLALFCHDPILKRKFHEVDCEMRSDHLEELRLVLHDLKGLVHKGPRRRSLPPMEKLAKAV